MALIQNEYAYDCSTFYGERMTNYKAYIEKVFRQCVFEYGYSMLFYEQMMNHIICI